MKKIQLSFQVKQQNYTIFIGENLIEKLPVFFDLKKYSKSFVLTDKNIAPHFLDKLLRALPKNTAHFILPAGETTKNIQTVEKIWIALKNASCDRKSLVINLSGGAIGDMGGFAASTYMRGVDFINIPTTLDAQIDASVGGKTGINFAGIKNLIGTFNQPKAVIIDTQTLSTLPKRVFVSSFAEIIKHGLITDKNYFKTVTNKPPLDFSTSELTEIIVRSCEIKKEIVESDVHEKGSRKLANFGHTVGHAVEAISLATAKPLLHGEAISIGMVAEATLSQLVGNISKKDVQMIREALQKTGLPVKVKNFDKKAVFEKMRSDKKNENGKITFTLLEKIGKAVFNQYGKEELIEEALEEILE